MRWTSLAAPAAVAGLIALGAPGALPAADDIAIGTGEPGGSHHRLGRALCRLVESGRDAHGVGCEALATPGALFNLTNIRTGAIELGLVPSDLHYHAVAKSGPFRFVDASYDDLRSLFSLHAELFTLVVGRDAGIEGLDDLEGRRVNIGVWGSAERGLVDAVVAAKGWTGSDFLLTEELPVSQQSMAFCHGRLDAIVYSVSHPNRNVAQVLELCDAVLVGVTAEEVARVQVNHPYYLAGEIPAGSDPSAAKPLGTFGTKVTLVTSSLTDADTVYAVVKSVFENLDRLRRSHRSLASVEPAQMVSEGLSAPLHEGAQRYYQEAGLLP